MITKLSREEFDGIAIAVRLPSGFVYHYPDEPDLIPVIYAPDGSVWCEVTSLERVQVAARVARRRYFEFYP